MKAAPLTLICRALLGLIFVVFGLNWFLGFMPMPPQADHVAAFMAGLSQAPYFFPLLKGAEVFGGVLLLTNRQVPLALLVLAPISLQIVLFNLVMAPNPFGIGMSAVILACGLYLAKVYWHHFRPIFVRP